MVSYHVVELIHMHNPAHA